MSAKTTADLIVEQIADALIFSDKNGSIRRWNAAAETMFGFTAEEALTQSLDIIIPEHLRAAHWRGFEAAMSNRTTRLEGRPTITRALHKLGHKLYVEMSFAIVIDDTGEVQGSATIARDVTERIEKERTIKSQTRPQDSQAS